MKDTWINETKCPSCNSESLFVGQGGYITCSRIDCPEPDYNKALSPKKPRLYMDYLPVVDNEGNTRLYSRFHSQKPSRTNYV